MKKYRLFLTIFVLYLIFCMIISPKLYIDVTLAGISAWAFNVLPAILPFMFFTKVLLNLETLNRPLSIFARPFYTCFKTPPTSCLVFIFSIISGYPVGSKMTADLYQNGTISREEAFRMSAFCSNSGPMFIIGTVGTMFLGNPKLGYIIFISHAVGALLNGLLYRNIKAENLKSEAKSSGKIDLSQMIIDSTLSVLTVGSIIAIFFVIITSLSPLISLLPQNLQGLASGLIEITRGCKEISLLQAPLATILSTFVISFGGISTILQSMTMLDKIKMPTWLFVLQKFTHALLATAVSCLMVLII